MTQLIAWFWQPRGLRHFEKRGEERRDSIVGLCWNILNSHKNEKSAKQIANTKDISKRVLNVFKKHRLETSTDNQG